MSKLLLSHGVQDIALVFRLVYPLFENEFAVFFLDSGVMSRHDMAAVEGLRPVKKLAELHISVAVNARIRCSSGIIGAYKPFDHLCAKILFEVENIIRHSEPERGAPRVFDVVERAAGAA